MKTYVLVSQVCRIYEISNKETAIEIANAENQRWADYVEKCVNNYEPYADNEILVYEVTDGNENNSKLIWDAGGAVKEDYFL